MDDEIPLPMLYILAEMPPGTYGLSYDIFTRPTEDDLPNGWHAYRATTYSQLARILQNQEFRRLQYSDWCCKRTDAQDAFVAMLSLMRLHPIGKFQSTVKGVKIHYITNWIFDGTLRIRLGGEYSPGLLGPTPRGLVPFDVPSQAPEQPLDPLPQYTQPSPQAMVIANWRVAPQAQV